MQESKPATLTLETSQKADGEKDSQKAVLRGSLWEKGETVHLIYEENGVKTHLRIREGLVHIHRLGELSGDLWFAEGEERDTRYETPYGRMMLTVHTHRIRWDRKRLSLSIRYNLLTEGQLLSMNEMMLEIREEQE